MWVLLCVTMVAGALGHYHLYDPRSDELQNDLDTLRQDLYGAPRRNLKQVDCPVCRFSHNNLDIESCPPSGSKICKHEIYRNPGCGNPDCFRGEGEPCTETPNAEGFVARCAPGYDCQLNKCVDPLKLNYNGERIRSQFLSQWPVL